MVNLPEEQEIESIRTGYFKPKPGDAIDFGIAGTETGRAGPIGVTLNVGDYDNEGELTASYTVEGIPEDYTAEELVVPDKKIKLPDKLLLYTKKGAPWALGALAVSVASGYLVHRVKTK